MLAYLGRGPRDYHRRPCSAHTRPCWEFQAIVAGVAAPLVPGARIAPQGRRLWVFPPSTRHGWTGVPDEDCAVAVFHFPEVPEPLRAHCLARRWHAAPLDAATARAVVALAEELDRDRAAPSDRSHVLHQRALAELTLIALANVPARRLPDGQALARRRVHEALAWYAEHLEYAPDMAEVAAAAHVSPAHLRRLCLRVLGKPPQRACDEVRYRRAQELLADPEARLESVAAACGFASASALSRGFHAHCGMAPRVWRRRGAKRS